MQWRHVEQKIRFNGATIATLPKTGGGVVRGDFLRLHLPTLARVMAMAFAATMDHIHLIEGLVILLNGSKSNVIQVMQLDQKSVLLGRQISNSRLILKGHVQELKQQVHISVKVLILKIDLENTLDLGLVNKNAEEKLAFWGSKQESVGSAWHCLPSPIQPLTTHQHSMPLIFSFPWSFAKGEEQV